MKQDISPLHNDEKLLQVFGEGDDDDDYDYDDDDSFPPKLTRGV